MGLPLPSHSPKHLPGQQGFTGLLQLPWPSLTGCWRIAGQHGAMALGIYASGTSEKGIQGQIDPLSKQLYPGGRETQGERSLLISLVPFSGSSLQRPKDNLTSANSSPQLFASSPWARQDCPQGNQQHNATALSWPLN